MRFHALILALIPIALALSAPAAAQTPASTRDSGDAAHLFAYWPKKGMGKRFDEGYRTHLQWHRGKHDPLVWYAWYVYDGDRAGLFIDGSFGAPFAAFDHRVDPAGDGADGERNVTPYADTAFRASYRLRRELSTGFPLERWKPSKSVQVFHYTLRAGTVARFEKAVRAAREALLRQGDAPAHTWYELVVGGKAPAYLLMVARDGWKSFDSHGDGLDALVARSADARTLLDDLAASVAEVKVETWGYREDLSLIPES
jgi:hypothetical protein